MPPRKVPSPLAMTGKSCGGISHPSTGSWEHRSAKDLPSISTSDWSSSFSMSLSQGNTLNMFVHTRTPVLHESLSANTKINIVYLQDQQGWTERCCHVAPAEAHVPVLRESVTPANILDFPTPPSFPSLPLSPPPHFCFLSMAFLKYQGVFFALTSLRS